MEQITFEQTAQELVKQLESTLARMAVAADSNISTYNLENNAKKISGKLKEISFLNGLILYKDIEGKTEIYNPERDLKDDSLFMRYAKICKIS